MDCQRRVSGWVGELWVGGCGCGWACLGALGAREQVRAVAEAVVLDLGDEAEGALEKRGRTRGMKIRKAASGAASDDT